MLLSSRRGVRLLWESRYVLRRLAESVLRLQLIVSPLIKRLDDFLDPAASAVERAFKFLWGVLVDVLAACWSVVRLVLAAGWVIGIWVLVAGLTLLGLAVLFAVARFAYGLFF